MNGLALRLLDGFDKYVRVSSRMLLSGKSDNWNRRFRWSNPMGLTGLHYIAYLGIVEMVGLLDMKKWDSNAADVESNTTISWAPIKG